MAQEHAAQCRRQCQRVDRRDQHCHADGDRELAEQRAGDAGDEAYRHEHRQQYERDRDHRAGDLPHRHLGCLAGRHVRVFGHHAFGVLHHHDRVIHDHADAEYQGEQRYGVGGKADGQQDGERADQAYRNGDDGNDRRSDIAEEQEHDEYDQREGDGERLLHFVDRGCDERRTVVEYAGLQAIGEALAEFVQRRLHARRGLHRIGTGREKEADGHRRVAVQPALGVHARRTKLYTRDVGQPQHRAVRIGADHDAAELLGGDQASLRLHVELELGRIAGRSCADAAHRRLHILLLDRRDDVRGREIQADQPVHVEPDAHRVIQPSEQLRIADARRARQAVQHVDGDVVADEQRVLLAALAVELQELQDRGGTLAHGKAVALHLGRQLGQRLLHAIVDVDRVDVGIGSQLEADGQRVAAVVAAVGLHVDHLVDADDLRFQRLRDRRLHHRGGCARVAGGDRHLRRHDVGKLRDRDAQQRQDARKRHQDGEDDRQPRAIDEDGGYHAATGPPVSVRPALARRGRAPPGCLAARAGCPRARPCRLPSGPP